MQIYRIFGLLKRSFILIQRDTHRFLDHIYWPTEYILVWGFTGYWLQQQDMSFQIALVLLTCLVYWIFLEQIHKEIPWNLLDEFWSHNFSNLFSSPLKLTEWVTANMIMGILKGFVILMYCYGIVWLVYGQNVFSIGLMSVLCLANLALFAWALSFFTASCLIFYGQKIQVMTWIMGWFFAPFSGVFYPVDVLPYWAQTISYCLPPTYIFKIIRNLIMDGTFKSSDFLTALLLGIGYFIITATLFKFTFERSKVYGLARLEQYE